MSKKEVIIYKLNDEEKNILKLELDKETITRYLLQMKWNFNQTYQLMMNIFKKIFNSKKNNNILAKELISNIEELEKYELMVLKIYKIIIIYFIFRRKQSKFSHLLSNIRFITVTTFIIFYYYFFHYWIIIT